MPKLGLLRDLLVLLGAVQCLVDDLLLILYGKEGYLLLMLGQLYEHLVLHEG